MQFKLTEQNNKNKRNFRVREGSTLLRQCRPQNHKTNNKPNEPAVGGKKNKRKHSPLVFSFISPTNKADKSETKIFSFQKGKTQKGNFCANATCEYASALGLKREEKCKKAN